MILEPFAPTAQPASAALSDTSATTPRYDYDLVIVGGGLVGTTLACALQDSGLRVALVEAKSESAAVARGQAYHVNLAASRIFQDIGVWERMRPEVNPIEQIHLSDADYPGILRFGVKDLNTEVLGYVAEHRVLLESLQEQLRQCPEVTHLCPAELVQATYHPHGVALELKQANTSQQVWTKLLVAADGARSPIRQQAGIPTRGWQYWQACVVAFIKPEKSHQNIAYERFQTAGPFAILPLPGNLCRIVWTAPKAEAEMIATLDREEFLQELQKRYGNQMGNLELVGDRSVFYVQLMHSTRYVQSRLALMGDAAHCCHPVGGQGVNMGFRDAAALAEVLRTAHQQGEDIGNLAVLRRYERWRKFENLTILGFTDFLVRTFSNTVLPLVILRRFGLRIMQWVQPIKTTALRLMTGLLGRAPKLSPRQT